VLATREDEGGKRGGGVPGEARSEPIWRLGSRGAAAPARGAARAGAEPPLSMGGRREVGAEDEAGRRGRAGDGADRARVW
jgi:hypothetical protein